MLTPQPFRLLWLGWDIKLKTKLTSFCELVLKFNPVLNLISPKDIQSLQAKHISDAEESFRVFMDIYGQSNDYSVYDLGSGNGTPGIVWAILDRDTAFNLVELDSRKAEFLRHCVRELSLSNVKVINRDFKALVFPINSVLIARAFMNINKLLRFENVLKNPCFLLKGSTWNNELNGVQHLSLCAHEYSLANGDKRHLVVHIPKNTQD